MADILAFIEKQQAVVAQARAARLKAQRAEEQAVADLAAAERTAVLLGLIDESTQPDEEEGDQAALPAPPLALAPPTHPRLNAFDPASSVGLSMQVLREEGKPLHGKELLKRIHALGSDVQMRTLTSSLAKLVREGRVFMRTGPNMYGLKEWGTAATSPQNGTRQLSMHH